MNKEEPTTRKPQIAPDENLEQRFGIRLSANGHKPRGLERSSFIYILFSGISLVIAAAAYVVVSDRSTEFATSLVGGLLASSGALLILAGYTVSQILAWRSLYHFRLYKQTENIRSYAVGHISKIEEFLADRFGEGVEETLDAPTEMAAPTDMKSDVLATRERDSMRRIIIGMAIKGYSYDPGAARSPIAREISEDLATLGISISDETVLKYLKDAASVLPRKQRDG